MDSLSSDSVVMPNHMALPTGLAIAALLCYMGDGPRHPSSKAKDEPIIPEDRSSTSPLDEPVPSPGTTFAEAALEELYKSRLTPMGYAKRMEEEGAPTEAVSPPIPEDPSPSPTEEQVLS